jgi:Zn-finger nucleic acid-binding protein
VWLDGGELRHLFEWMKAGGKLLQQEKDEERRRNETRELEREQRKMLAKSSSGAYPEDSSYNMFGGTLMESDVDLFCIVKKAISFFVK